MRHYAYRGNRFLWGYVLIGFALLWLFGFKLFFLLPIFLLFAFWSSGSRGICVSGWDDGPSEKPKRQPIEDAPAEDEPIIV